MAEDQRNRRRGLLEVLEFARANENGVTNIESRKPIISAINFSIELPVRKAIRRAIKKNGSEQVELISGDYFIYDLTDKIPPRLCKLAACSERARVLESRLIFAYDEKDQEYHLGEFSEVVRKILLETRKRAAICDDHMLDAQIKGEVLDIYERIPQIGELARVSKIAAIDPVDLKVIRASFRAGSRPANTTGKGATVIGLFDKKKR